MSAPSSLPTPTATPRLPKGTLNANGSLNRTQQAWPGDAMTRHCSSFCVLADRHTPAYKSRQSEPSERSRPSRGAASSLPALLGFPPLCRSPRLSAASRCPRACAESHGHGHRHGHYGVNSLPSLHVCSVPSLSPLSPSGAPASSKTRPGFLIFLWCQRPNCANVWSVFVQIFLSRRIFLGQALFVEGGAVALPGNLVH